MKKSLRFLTLSSMVLAMTSQVQSAAISVDEARNIASEFMNRNSGSVRTVSKSPVYVAGTAASPLYYVFNSSDGGAFVIVSADDSTIPVLGFSFESGYAVEQAPEAMQWMLEGLQRELKVAPSLQSSLSMTERRNLSRSAENGQEKLLSTPNWSQEAPFNNLIPGRPLVGCVGTAMSMIMKYHSWPENGSGSFGDVDFNTPYDWTSMRSDNYRSGYSETEGTAVATLMYHASKSIDTQYSMSGSSAYEVRVPYALSTFFGYDPGVSYKKRAEVGTQQDWDNLVKSEIDAGRPVLYCGQDVTAGHAFVCDGYKGDYLHFNWGWGGSANGYFLSTALNPTVSRTHHYNNLNTIIYNIKAASGEISNWSQLHITSDGNQVGMGSDLTDLSNGSAFTLRVGNIKNLAFNDFAGKIAVALCASNGSVRTLLSGEQNLTIQSMQVLNSGYLQFRNCKLPSGVSVANGDAIRIVAKANGTEEWLPLAGELLTVNYLSPEQTPATFNVSLASQPAGVTMEGETSVVRGWDYTFKAVLENPASDVLTVKANGYVLTPDGNNNYTIYNVREDQLITLIVQNAADVKEKRSFWIGTPGSLSSLISDEESGVIKDLTLFGTIDANDFFFMRDKMQLNRVDLSGVTIIANGSNQANAIPREAFRGCGHLKEVILPKSVNRLNNGCFRQCGITSIILPANIKTYEYNIFVAATSLRDIYVGRETAEFINWCVLSGVKTNLVTLHCPSERAVNNYKNAENWNTIANIIVDPIPADNDALFAVQESSNVDFDSQVAPGKLTPGTEVTFTAKYLPENDNRLEVYANSMLLSADANGMYHTTVNGNTIIHFDEIEPTAVDSHKSAWKLTGANGSVGMLTDAVNVIPGEEFTVRLNALDIPEWYDQLYWAIALTDSKGNIKEFISTPTVWSAGAGKNFKLNVTCKVNNSNVREDNQLRLVTSAMKKTWNLVEAEGEGVVASLPAVNNMNEVYNITISGNEGANVSGVPETAIRGRDITMLVSPTSGQNRVDVKVNGVEVAHESASVNYTFVVNSDVDIELKVYNPKEEGAVVYNVEPGQLYKAVTAQTIRANVVVTGSTWASDLALAMQQLFVQNTVKKLDLSGLTIVANPNPTSDADRKENYLPSELFYRSSGIGQTKPILEEIILPNSVTMIGEGAFQYCEKMKEITLPMSLLPDRIQVGTFASGSPKYGYPLGTQAFKGCTSLTTIYIPGPINTNGNRQIVCHFNPYCSYYDIWSFLNPDPYHLGHEDASKVTVVVPNEYLNVYRTKYSDYSYGNPWQALGYNILAENPIYGMNFDPSRVEAINSEIDFTKLASFLGDNVKVDSITTPSNIKLKNLDIPCLVYDNGKEIKVNSDGTIGDVTFYNPAKYPALSGNHEIKVVYVKDVVFNTQSTHFAVKDVVVTNEEDIHPEKLDNTAENPVLHNVAENSTVQFGIEFTSEHADAMDVRVMLGQEVLEADENGIYTVSVSNANREVTIYAVPGEGATLSAEDLESINPDEAAAISSISFEGEMTPEELLNALNMFSGLENLDLSNMNGELPENAFAGMDNLTSVSLPETETISNGLFDGCSSLQTIEIPESVNVIGSNAFKGCESLETIRLTGITEIGDGAFDGCTSLTSITLLANAGEHNGNAKPRRANISNDAFSGINPNCVIILDEGVSLPAVDGNYITTASGLISETQPDGSVIEREGRIYSAGSNLTFSTGYPLAIPHSFTLDEDKSATLQAKMGTVNSLTIPFDVASISNDEGEDVEIVLPVIEAENSAVKKGRMAGSNELNVFTSESDQEGLIAKTELKANTPYIVLPGESGTYTLHATKGKVSNTPSEITSAGKDFELHSSYTTKVLPASETYILNHNASAFEKAGEEDDETVSIKPFRVYATSPAHVSYIETMIPGIQLETEVEDITEINGMVIMKNGNMLVILSDQERDLTIYTVDGRVLKVVKLEVGRNETEAPEAGIYIIGDTRVRL